MKSLVNYQLNLIAYQDTETWGIRCKEILCILGHFLLDTRASNVERDLVIRIEIFLNEISKQAKARGWTHRNKVYRAVGYAATLVDIDKKTDELMRHRHPDFGMYCKELGELLQLIGNDPS